MRPFSGFRQSVFCKITSILLVIILSSSTICFALTEDTRYTKISDGLATPTFFKPLTDNGIQRSSELEFEVLTGIKLLHAGQTISTVNGLLSETYRNTASKRKVEFLPNITRESGTTIARFKVIGHEDFIFRISYRAGVSPGDDAVIAIRKDPVSSVERQPLRADSFFSQDQIILSASLLSVASPSDFGKKSVEAIRSGADFVHFDVGEGNKGKTAILREGSMDTTAIYTPNQLRTIKEAGIKEGVYIPVDVHLLIMEPSEDYLRAYLDAGADVIWIHWEAFEDKSRLRKRLEFIKSRGAKAGIIMRPDVDIHKVGSFITTDAPGSVDMISQAGVYPFYDGQVFAFDAVIKNIKILRGEYRFVGPIAVDGGVEAELSSKVAIEAGADFIVAGSAFFGDGSRSPDGMKRASDGLRDRSPIDCGSIYDVIAKRILDLRRDKSGKLWIKVSAFHSGGKTFTTAKLIEILKAANPELNIISFAQDSFWSSREERKLRREAGDPTYNNGLTHLRMKDLNEAMAVLKDASGDVIFNNIYDFDSGRIDAKQTHHVTGDSIIIMEGCYLDAVDKTDFDLSIYLRTDYKQAKERAMIRDEIKFIAIHAIRSGFTKRSMSLRMRSMRRCIIRNRWPI